MLKMDKPGLTEVIFQNLLSILIDSILFFFFFPPGISRNLPMPIPRFEDQWKMASVAVNVHQVRIFQRALCFGCLARRDQWVTALVGQRG